MTPGEGAIARQGPSDQVTGNRDAAGPVKHRPRPIRPGQPGWDANGQPRASAHCSPGTTLPKSGGRTHPAAVRSDPRNAGGAQSLGPRGTADTGRAGMQACDHSEVQGYAGARTDLPRDLRNQAPEARIRGTGDETLSTPNRYSGRRAAGTSTFRGKPGEIGNRPNIVAPRTAVAPAAASDPSTRHWPHGSKTLPRTRDGTTHHKRADEPRKRSTWGTPRPTRQTGWDLRPGRRATQGQDQRPPRTMSHQ